MKKIAVISVLVWALFDSGAAAAAAGGWTWPVRGPVITAYRNGDDPYAAGQHRGVDIAAPVGTAVVAATSGSVVFAGVVGSSGLTVAERTADGRYELSYLHLSALAVRAGERVEGGTRLGAVGVSGQRSAEQPHLHFGVRDANARQSYHDPLDFLAPPPAAGDPQPRPAPVPLAAPARAPESPAPAAAPALAPGGAPTPDAPGLRLPHPLELAGGAHRTAGRPHVPAGTHLSTPALPAAAGSSAQHAAEAGGAPAAGEPRVTRPQHVDPRAPGRGPVGASPAPDQARALRRAAHPHPRASHGIDLAWLAACIGLIAAAAVLGGPSHRRGRTGALALLRPLLRPEARQ